MEVTSSPVCSGAPTDVDELLRSAGVGISNETDGTLLKVLPESKACRIA
jgi:hypothetical protein